MFIFPRRQEFYHLFGSETLSLANRAITALSWDHLVYLHDLAVHKDHLSYHRMTSQSAKQLWQLRRHLKCLHDDISGPCVSLLILVPKLRGTVPLKLRLLLITYTFLCCGIHFEQIS